MRDGSIWQHQEEICPLRLFCTPIKSLNLHLQTGSGLFVIPSMSRRGNCYDNADIESFFKTLKKECVRKYIFKIQEEAKRKIFEYIEMFYNPKDGIVTWIISLPTTLRLRYYSDMKEEEVLTTNFVSTEQESSQSFNLN
jgi:transposase InsO family protein